MPKRSGGGNRFGVTALPGLLAAAFRGRGKRTAPKRSSAPTAAKYVGRRNRAAFTYSKRGSAYLKNKQNMRKNVIRSMSGGLPSMSGFGLSSRPSPRVKAMKRVGAENIYCNNNAKQLVVAEGFQNATEYSWQNWADLKQLLNKVPGGYPAQPKQFVLESTTAEFLITNSSIATQYVDIYDIVRKRDPGYFPGDQDSDQNPTQTPLNAWKVGVSDQTPTAPDYTAYQMVNSLPTDSRLLKDFFHIKKRTHIGLAQGATHRHRVTLRPNRLIDSELVNRANGDPTGVTAYTLIVAYGQPASIKNEGGAIVTTASGAIDVVVSQRMKYTYVVDNVVAWTATDNLSTLTGEFIAPFGSGLVVANEYV